MAVAYAIRVNAIVVGERQHPRTEQIAEWIRLTEAQVATKAVSAQDAPKLSRRGRRGEGRIIGLPGIVTILPVSDSFEEAACRSALPAGLGGGHG